MESSENVLQNYWTIAYISALFRPRKDRIYPILSHFKFIILKNNVFFDPAMHVCKMINFLFRIIPLKDIGRGRLISGGSNNHTFVFCLANFC